MRYREFWGTGKRAELEADGTGNDLNIKYETVTPMKANRYSFRPSAVSDDYYAWPKVGELAEFKPSLGILENRRNALISIDRAPLEDRMRLYFNPAITWQQVAALQTGLTQDAAVFDARRVRQRLMALEKFRPENVRPMMLLPMDVRWCYHTVGPQLWNRSRPDYARQVWPGNAFLVIRNIAVADPEGVPFFYSSIIGYQHAFHKDAYYVPLMLRPPDAPATGTAGQTSFLDNDEQTVPTATANLSPAARAYLATLGIKDPDASMDTAALVWRHVLAVGYAPAYLAEHEDGIRADWPRVPLPANPGTLRASADLGTRLAALLDTEQPAPGVTSGPLRPELRTIADLATVDGRPPDPSAGDFDLRARWGYASTNGIVMGGPGRLVRREYTAEEVTAIGDGVAALGLPLDQALDQLGRATCDIYLNDRVYWRNIPGRVWDFTIGGYQVMKKWLSYRERDLLGRALTIEEVRHVIGMARRLASVRLLESALDANYAAVTADTYPWPSLAPPSAADAG